MKQGAITSPLAAVPGSSAAAMPCLRSTHLYASRIPEFAHAQWLAVQRAHFCTDEEAEPPRRPQGIHTYAVLEQGRPAVLFFFQVEKNKVRVWHEPGQECGEELRAFSRYVFEHFPAVRHIGFVAQQRFIQVKGRKHRRQSAQRLLLPAQLSTRMEEALRFSRSNVKFFLQRLKQDGLAIEVQCYTDEAAAAYCRTLLQWNRPQLAGPHPVAGSLDESGENLVRAVQQAGLVCVLKIGGRVAAGAICLRSGSDWQLHRLAHDPRFQAYGLGMLCCYFTACELIDRQRNRPAATTGKPRATHELAASRTRITVLTLHRPHASWLVRCDHALYATSMDYWQRTLQVRDDCLQLGHSLVQLVSAWRVAARMMKKRLASCWRYSALPAFLRSH